MNAARALQRLRDGNHRFAAGTWRPDVERIHAERAGLAQQQRPFAVILGCSDSRVPVEMVFDQTPGDLFVIRVAGNVVASTQRESVEFAVTQLDTPLVVVLGHSGCGAIAATLAAMREPAAPPATAPRAADAEPRLHSIVERIRPALEAWSRAHPDATDEDRARHAVRANVEFAMHGLREGSEFLQRRERDGGLRVVGAEYDLRTGEVQWFEET